MQQRNMRKMTNDYRKQMKSLLKHTDIYPYVEQLKYHYYGLDLKTNLSLLNLRLEGFGIESRTK